MQSCALFFLCYCVLDLLAFLFHKLFLYIFVVLYSLALESLKKCVRGHVQYTTRASYDTCSKLMNFSHASISLILSGVLLAAHSCTSMRMFVFQ